MKKIVIWYSAKTVKKNDKLCDFIRYEYIDFIEFNKRFLHDKYCYNKFTMVIQKSALSF